MRGEHARRHHAVPGLLAKSRGTYQCCRGRRCWSCIGPERRGFRRLRAYLEEAATASLAPPRRAPDYHSSKIFVHSISTNPPPSSFATDMVCSGSTPSSTTLPTLRTPFLPPRTRCRLRECAKSDRASSCGGDAVLLMTPTAPRMPMPHAMMGAATALRSTLQTLAPREVFQSISSEPEAGRDVPRPVVSAHLPPGA